MRAALRSFWNEPPIPDPPRRVWRDWALVALLVPLCVVEVIVREDASYRWMGFVVALVGIPFLLIRRTHPLLCTTLVFGTALATPWWGRPASADTIGEAMMHLQGGPHGAAGATRTARVQRGIQGPHG